MDLKAISWVGNIYQKFEAMCLEVEEVMYQDTVDYVENQVQTVGASMKKFYSEIMQDLHPESYVDPVKVAAADLSLNPYAHHEIEKKQKASLKEHSRGTDMKFTEDTEVIKGKSKHGGIYKRRSVGNRKNAKDNYPPLRMYLPVTPLSSERTRKSSGCGIREGYEMASDRMDETFHLPSAKGYASREMVSETCDPKSDTNMHTTSSSIDNAVSGTALKDEYAEQKQDPGCTSPFGGSSSGSSGTPHGQLTDGTISHTGDSTINNGSAERSENHDFDVLEAGDVLEQEVEVDRDVESRLEETCVLVEGDELLAPQDPVKHKSYKKKIREAFSSRMRLTRKEYENLATRYENQPSNRDSEEKEVGMKASTKVSSASDFPDSEWELL
ncbi:uncharacterized protein LOC115996554 isoform X1 [Ipomoea triloba]|uniref:uncharacterized protein LOC115996554 isoform X1 n=1 Tax=Ipomoea triloba TaxID=35885 RepID=UPI00125DB0A7|nr:uncharacterized protein LOC115996554 isoform X1 [Ipomoea triloba]XP_031091687.1 uncharacterized protein LOC115996554 isoform X1 [Ipomoea triloba]XP_031091688.1 uncharacterized protein LOC115996554 isoform X1 [Ipomoea triloba]